MDREKVIKGLECCMVIESTESCLSCPYNYDDYELGENPCLREKLIPDAIDLLKEQETEAELEGGGTSWWYVCGECHTAIDKRDHFCRQCGRRIKWE